MILNELNTNKLFVGSKNVQSIYLGEKKIYPPEEDNEWGSVVKDFTIIKNVTSYDEKTGRLFYDVNQDYREWKYANAQLSKLLKAGTYRLTFEMERFNSTYATVYGQGGCLWVSSNESTRLYLVAEGSNSAGVAHLTTSGEFTIAEDTTVKIMFKTGCRYYIYIYLKKLS